MLKGRNVRVVLLAFGDYPGRSNWNYPLLDDDAHIPIAKDVNDFSDYVIRTFKFGRGIPTSTLTSIATPSATTTTTPTQTSTHTPIPSNTPIITATLGLNANTVTVTSIYPTAIPTPVDSPIKTRTLNFIWILLGYYDLILYFLIFALILFGGYKLWKRRAAIKLIFLTSSAGFASAVGQNLPQLAMTGKILLFLWRFSVFTRIAFFNQKILAWQSGVGKYIALTQGSSFVNKDEFDKDDNLNHLRKLLELLRSKNDFNLHDQWSKLIINCAHSSHPRVNNIVGQDINLQCARNKDSSYWTLLEKHGMKAKILKAMIDTQRG